MVAAPNIPGRVIVATATGIRSYQDGIELPNPFFSSSALKYLGFAGTNLWLAVPHQLFRLAVNSGGVSLAEAINISLPTDYYRFVADTERLYFDSYNFQINSRTVTPGTATSGG